jgi:hypothetical protein
MPELEFMNICFPNSPYPCSIRSQPETLIVNTIASRNCVTGGHMARTSLTICLVLGILTSGCTKKNVPKTGGGPGPQKFADCNQDKGVDWTGHDICAQENTPEHYFTSAVQVSHAHCAGIHITHTKDFRLDVLLRRENLTKSCPLQPFETPFPVHSGSQHVRDFKTGRVSDNAAEGCQYEIHLTEIDNPGQCDPHVDITP